VKREKERERETDRERGERGEREEERERERERREREREKERARESWGSIHRHACGCMGLYSTKACPLSFTQLKHVLSVSKGVDRWERYGLRYLLPQ
jgi:hypothetical protein